MDEEPERAALFPPKASPEPSSLNHDLSTTSPLRPSPRTEPSPSISYTHLPTPQHLHSTLPNPRHPIRYAPDVWQRQKSPHDRQLAHKVEDHGEEITVDA